MELVASRNVSRRQAERQDNRRVHLLLCHNSHSSHRSRAIPCCRTSCDSSFNRTPRSHRQVADSFASTPQKTDEVREMVGIFSRFAAGRTGHRRTKSATETRETQSASMETGDESSTSTRKDNDNARVEFKPIEHPLEPSNHDRPIRCPLPDPSLLLNDVIVGKERTSSSSIEGPSARARDDDGTVPNSISEPEHHLITALEDSNPAHG